MIEYFTMSTPHEAFVKPGAGVEVEVERLGPIRTSLQDGTYIVDEIAQQTIRDALSDPDLSIADVRQALNNPLNKGFRNAYTSVVMERIWPQYEDQVTSGQLQTIRFEGDVSRLEPITPSRSPSHTDIAELIAATNQDVPTHLICELFRGGEVPVISGNPQKDRVYFDAFYEQTELLTSRTDSFFPTAPKEVGPPSLFIASGLLVLRTHVFGVPNLMDEVAGREGLALSPADHRNGFDATMQRTTSHYYLPTGLVTIAINSQLVDFRTGLLRPEQWTSNRDPEKYVVYPRPDIVAGVNETARGQDLPVQTNCPAFHSRVPDREQGRDITLPLPRSLAALALRQLDISYYPARQSWYDRQPGTFFVSRPDWAISADNALGASFPNGLFITGAYKAPPTQNNESGRPASPLTEREALILESLGEEGGRASFSMVMGAVETTVVAEELPGADPDARHHQLQRFYRRAMVAADGVFDSERSQFSSSAADGESFLAALYAIPITRLDPKLSVTAGETLGIFHKLVHDPALYPPQATAVIEASFNEFLHTGVIGMSRRESTDLSARQTQQVKETTNGLYAGLLFDIAHAPFADRQGYPKARDRYIAAKLAYQYNDEILDVLTDAAEGSSNLVSALAVENGEAEALRQAAGQLQSLLPPGGLDPQNPDAMRAYYELLHQVAPKSYDIIARRQHVLLQQANLPPQMTAIIALPL